MAYRLAEHERVRLPVIVNQDGFYLSFTREPVQVPDAKRARNFVGDYNPENMRFRASSPSSQAVAVLGGAPYSYFRYETHLAAMEALSVYDDIANEFNEQFGRYHPAVEAYRTDDADYAFVMMDCFATKAKDAVDRLRDSGIKIGLVRPRLLRPFPQRALQNALSGKKAVGVIDQNLSMGKGGVLHTEIASALYGQDGNAPILASFIGGLGGRDISAEEFYQIATTLQDAAKQNSTPAPRLLYTEPEMRNMRKLQAIAHVEREELETKT
jgi:pyruvate ferredoxin oxidoreductase alpha subunit